MSDFFKSLVKELKDPNTSILEDGESSAEFSGCIDTGSYILNAVLSGSLYGGVPNNKITAFAGESATGKTFFVLGVVKQFLKDNPNGGVIYYDTEAAVTKEMMSKRGVDTKRVVIAEPDTIQKFRTHAMKVLESYDKQPKDTRPPMMMVLDSLGLLSTTKEVEDTTEGKDVRDMTKSQVIKGAFRVLTLKLAQVGVPMLVTNHVYELVGSYVPTKEMGGGCLVKGTKIRTNSGLVEIQDVKIGDKVLTLDGECEVTNTFEFDDKDVFEVGFEDGTSVRCSADHKFLSDGNWVSVKEMIDNSYLPVVHKIHGSSVRISCIKKVEKERVYDITVKEQHHYILENGVVTHNSGLKYAASTIAFLSKKKEKDGDGDVIGNIIRVAMQKSRFTKEHSRVEVLLTFDKGLDRYYGLLELAEKHGIFKKVSTRYELPDGSTAFGKQINNNPEKYYTTEVMEQLELTAAKEFKYGLGE